MFKKDGNVLAGVNIALLDQKEPFVQKSFVLEGKQYHLYSNASKSIVYTQDESKEGVVQLKEWVKALSPDKGSSLSFRWRITPGEGGNGNIFLKPLSDGSVGIYHKINVSGIDPRNPIKRKHLIKRVRKALQKINPNLNIEDKPFAVITPVVYWTRQGVQKSVPYSLSSSHEVSFSIQEPESSYPLLIDPTVNWAQYLGGSGTDAVYALAVNGDEIYAGGSSSASGSWETVTFQGSFTTADEGFVVEMADASPPTLTWGQWLGGTGTDIVRGMAVNDNEVYAVGSATTSVTWEGTFEGSHNGASEGFVVEITDTDGGNPAVAWGQWLGSSGGGSVVYVVAVNGDEIYAGGTTSAAATFETVTFQGTHSGSTETFIVEIADGNTPGFQSLTWAQWLGGTAADIVRGLAVTGNEIYVGGYSANSTSWESTFSGSHTSAGVDDGFIVNIVDDGGGADTPSVPWGQWLGGSNFDYIYGLAVNDTNEIYVVGYSQGTASWESTPSGAFAGSYEDFVAEIVDNNSGSSVTLSWAQWLGGGGDEFPIGVAVNGNEIYVTGYGNSTWSEVTVSGTQSGNEVFIAEILDGPTVNWAQWIGGTSDELGYSAIAINGNEIYTGGTTGGSSTWDATPSGTFGGGNEGFVSEFNDDRDIKTINGLAIASVKTAKGTAIASVKSVNGLE